MVVEDQGSDVVEAVDESIGRRRVDKAMEPAVEVGKVGSDDRYPPGALDSPRATLRVGVVLVGLGKARASDCHYCGLSGARPRTFSPSSASSTSPSEAISDFASSCAARSFLAPRSSTEASQIHCNPRRPVAFTLARTGQKCGRAHSRAARSRPAFTILPAWPAPVHCSRRGIGLPRGNSAHPGANEKDSPLGRRSLVPYRRGPGAILVSRVS
jgi:hypothetical protein